MALDCSSAVPAAHDDDSSAHSVPITITRCVLCVVSYTHQVHSTLVLQVGVMAGDLVLSVNNETAFPAEVTLKQMTSGLAQHLGRPLVLHTVRGWRPPEGGQ